MEIRTRETKWFENINELALYQQREIRSLLDGMPATAPVRSLQFRYKNMRDITRTDLPESYGIVIEEEKTIDIDPLSNNRPREP